MTDQALKRRLQRRLDQSGRTRAWLAREMGEHENQVARWMKGKERVPATFIARFVELIPTDPTWLLTGTGQPEPVPADTKSRAFDDIAEIVARATAQAEDGRRPPESLSVESAKVGLREKVREQEGKRPRRKRGGTG